MKWFVNIVLVIVGFICLFLAFRVGVGYNANDIDVTWDAFNTSIALLELYIVLFSISIAFMGIWGFREIKKSCIAAVREDMQKTYSQIENEAKKKIDAIGSDAWEGFTEK